MEARLPEIKLPVGTRYINHQYPRSVNRLHGSTFLLTNTSQLCFYCPTQQFSDNDTEHVLDLQGIQTIHKFDCHCDMIHVDEFRIVPDLNFCNESEDITEISTIHYPINLAYLSEYFTTADLFNLTANTLLNHSVEIQLPNLAIADKFLDERFAQEESAAFDLKMVINSTKTSAQVYDNLAHYLFNQMVKAHDSENKFDLLSSFTWVTIFGWITSIIALALVIMLHIKVCSLTMMMAIKAADVALALPSVISMTQPTTVAESSVDALKEWTKHVGYITELVPIEVMILMCLLLWFAFKVARIIYAARCADTARTRLVLEIRNGTDMVLLPIINLPHASRYYRLVINRSEITFLLTESNLTPKCHGTGHNAV